MPVKKSAAIVCVCVVLLSGCRTFDKTAGIKEYDTVDYTSESVAVTECERIERLLNSQLNTRALWRAVLLSNHIQDSSAAQKMLERCHQAVVDEYSESVLKEDWQNALRCYVSLQSCSYPELSKLPLSRTTLESCVINDAPGLKNETVPGSDRVSQYIRGTVTVYVDKGFKVERGMGIQDAMLGSGFFISHDGYIVTNHHVISAMVDPKYEGYARLYIKLADDPDTRIPAKVVGWDSVLDLALLKAEVDAPYVFSLGFSSDLDVGDKVYAIGSPLGLDRTLTSGVISAKDRRLFTEGVVFQIDAAVNSGNSGGPLIDASGKVQAIVFAGVENYQGLNFAIPVEYLRYELPVLYAGGERVHPWMCAYGKTERLPGANAKNEGVLVQYVMPGGSAALSGIQAGDVITAFDGIRVSSLEDLHRMFMQCLSETVVRVKVRHEDEKEEVVLVCLSSRPEQPGYEVYQTDLLEHSLLPLLGMELVRASTSKKLYSVSKVLKASAADELSFSESDTVQIVGVEFDATKSYIYVTVYTKRRKNGWLEMALALTAQLDSPYYF